MKNNIFGELHRALREKCNLSLRKYCIFAELDPGNISRIERGVIPPPQSEGTLSKMALTLGLKEESKDWKKFFDTAVITAGRLPKYVYEDEELLKKLPVLLRTIAGQRLSDEKMDELVDILRES